MFDNKSILINALKSPLTVSALALDEIENRLNGNKIIADPNTPFCHLLEFGSSVSSALMKNIDSRILDIYPQRAVTMKQLYNHMSDYDYIGSYATPAQAEMLMMIPTRELLDKSKYYNAKYNLVTLPRDTVINVDTYRFGIYYPINILINKDGNTFTVEYDTTEQNSLKELSTNIVDNYQVTVSSVNFLVFKFPVYQFSRSIIEEPIVAESGYSKSIRYNDKFYAVKIYNYVNGNYYEMSQTQSESVYDPLVATAMVRVYPDENRLGIFIPQVYFDNNVMGSKIYIEVYTTQGELNISTSGISTDSISANFTATGKYATEYGLFFKSLTHDAALQLYSSKIEGGSNGMNVRSLRDGIINDTLYSRVAVSEEELKAKLNTDGFYVTKSKDDVTDRIFYAYRVIETGQGSIVPSTNANIKLSSDICSDSPTCLLQTDDSYTLLPTTLYSYNSQVDAVVPLSSEEVSKIVNMNKVELVNYFNNNRIYRSPFHLRVEILDDTPDAKSYNLMTPKINKTIFVGSNYSVAPRILSYNASISHNSDMSGYYMGISVYKTDDLQQISEDDLLIYALIKTVDGYWVGVRCTLDHISETNDNRSVYQLHIATNYHITENGGLGVTNLQGESILAENIISLSPTIHLVFGIKRSLVSDYEESQLSLVDGLPSAIQSEYLILSRQYFEVELGYDLTDVIYNPVEISSTARSYKRWDHDVPRTYASDVYRTNKDGTLYYTVENEEVKLERLHKEGDVMIDMDGNTVYLHKKGDIVYDEAGAPVVASERSKLFYVNAIMLDARIFASERNEDLEFVNNLYENFESYFDLIRNTQNEMLERTTLYFRCVRSTGTAKFNYGDDNTGVSDVEMSFKINCYVPAYIKKDDDAQESIRNQIIAAIENAIDTRTISMIDIFTNVQEKLADQVETFSLLGVNGDTTNQTFVIMDDDAQPSIAKKLELSSDNVIRLVKQIDINFIALETNNGTETYSA